MPLSVLSVAYPFAPVSPDPVGGAEQVLSRLDGALIERGHCSTVLAMEGSRARGRLLGIPAPAGLIDEAARARAHGAVREAIAHCLRHEAVDLVHMHGVDFASYLPEAGVPVLVTLHMPLELYPARVLQAGRPGLWLLPVSRTQANAAFPQASLLPPIENGVALPPRASPARRSYALAMGRICPEKNFGAALDAARVAGFPLLLAGQVYPYREHLSHFATDIRPRLDAQRRWIGPVSGARKQRLLAGARCLLVPSLIAETCSLVALEALAAGTPVIAYRSGALPELIEQGRTGFIVDDVSSMAEALRRAHRIDPEVCREVVRQRFAVSRMITQYLALYARIARGAGCLPAHPMATPCGG